MFRLATCNDLIRLKARHARPGDRWLDPELGWGLKQMGTLFCYDRLGEALNGRVEPARVLEAGAGLNTAFDALIGDRCEYWMIDRSGFYKPEDYARITGERRRTTGVDGLLGKTEGLLPEGYFDQLFSISVLEHVPLNEIESVCRDMFRVVRPGGRIVHSIDGHAMSKHLPMWAQELPRAGFVFDEPAAVQWHVADPEPTLFEPLETQFKLYFGKGPEVRWKDPSRINALWGTVLVSARRPG